LTGIELRTNNFRILGDACIDFKPGLNIIFGPNATGKTSVLEAIGYCLRGRSFIGSKDSDVVTFGKDTFSLHFSLSADSDVATDHIQVEWDGRKRVTLNDKAIRSAKQLVERFKLVSQNPDSSGIATGSPSKRRDLIDDTASQMNTGWANTIVEYKTTVKERNSLLSSGASNDTLFSVLTEKIIELGLSLRSIRAEVAGYITNNTAPEGIELFVDDSTELSSANFSRLLYQERVRGITLIGPHRDDCYFTLNDRRVEQFASTGEARRVLLLVKLAQAKVITDACGQKPFILADDLLAELDDRNTMYAMEKLHEWPQTILTCARMPPSNDYNLIEVDQWAR